jgi:hypothetical protein
MVSALTMVLAFCTPAIGVCLPDRRAFQLLTSLQLHTQFPGNTLFPRNCAFDALGNVWGFLVLRSIHQKFTRL